MQISINPAIGRAETACIKRGLHRPEEQQANWIWIDFKFIVIWRAPADLNRPAVSTPRYYIQLCVTLIRISGSQTTKRVNWICVRSKIVRAKCNLRVWQKLQRGIDCFITSISFLNDVVFVITISGFTLVSSVTESIVKILILNLSKIFFYYLYMRFMHIYWKMYYISIIKL